MDTDIKHTVAMEPRALPRVSVHRSGPDAERTVTQPQAPTDSADSARQAESDTAASLEQAIADLSGYIQNVQRNLQFDVDDDSGHTVIRVVDAETDEVIRQIPSEEVLALARHLKGVSEAEQGLFLKEKV